MAQLCTITKAKQNLLELARRNRDLGESFILLKDGVPISALLPFEEYESLLETLDILESESDILKKLKERSQRGTTKPGKNTHRPLSGAEFSAV